MYAPTDAAWLAGLIEGEGCISVNTARGTTKYHKLRIQMTDLDVLEKAAGIMGVPVKPCKKQKPHHKDSWMIAIHSKDKLIEVLTEILPYLGERRSEKAREAIDAAHERRQARYA